MAPGGAARPSSAEQRAVIVAKRATYLADVTKEKLARMALDGINCQPLIDRVTSCVEALSTQLYGDEASLGHHGGRLPAPSMHVRACTWRHARRGPFLPARPASAA